MFIPLSLYIHIPWCVRKCPYCDFNSHALQGKLPEQQYLDALLDDLKTDLPLVQNRAIKSIFIGGGTPSLISPVGIEYLLNNISKLLQLDSNVEITLEANPGTIEHHDFAEFKTAGINRVSLGAQSFDDHKLQILGRIHKSIDIIHAVEKLHAINFQSFNIDLMHGLPAQTVDQALLDLQTALDLHAPHISWYQLTIEPNTVFYKYPPKLPNDDLTWEIQTRGEALLAAAGFEHYEVSAFAKANHECQHNLNYWSFGDYLGIGAGAHGKITNPISGQITRTWKTRLPKDYLDPTKGYLAGSSTLSTAEIPAEYMLNQLRVNRPIALENFTQRTGLPISSIVAILKTAETRGLVSLNDNILRVTELGQRFLNDLLQLFMHEVIYD